MRTAHDIIKLLPDDVHAEVIEGEVIVNAASPAGRHAKIILAVRRAFGGARHRQPLREHHAPGRA